MESRLNFFRERASHRRFWWFQEHNYLPAIYAELTNEEFDILKDWFIETEEKKLIGECGIPAMSAMLGFVQGSGIGKIVQLGTYAGYSTLMFGFALRRMGKERGLVTFDILPNISEFTQEWIRKAGLDEYVQVVVGDSTSEQTVVDAVEFLDSVPKMLFIDSSHQYKQTMEELNLWYPVLQVGGLIFLHDVSVAAKEYDTTGQGGVQRALYEWEKNYSLMSIAINAGHENVPLVYSDGCGLGIIQK